MVDMLTYQASALASGIVQDENSTLFSSLLNSEEGGEWGDR